ncbi:MAG: c-type cytochrome [bacterium]|nr:c-type cytochrome [bacterium]
MPRPSRLVDLSIVLFSCIACPPVFAQEQAEKSVAGNEKVAEILETFEPRGVQSDGSQPTPPDASLATFHLRSGFDIDLVASEPQISQPLFLSWDSRGRMWVVQYRQYQYPAGLKVVRFDHHLRAVFDKVPEPPPHHVPGQDRITVFEDTDHDGLYDTQKDVITGLNIATSVAIGHGGIWVLNPPYLLFYPDADGDDIPDSSPQVHLSGFGLQDTHSVANSLLWGPDGWLYGANGSTTGGTVSSQATPGIKFQGQCIWRYHPDRRVFEIYAEGGGNTFSLEIDSRGRVFCGTNGGNTRGWYLPQGSYSRKNWGKHGPLTNPFAFGFFEAMGFEGDPRRFPQAFTIYEGGLFPAEEFDGSIIAPNSMQNLVWHSRRIPDGSTYRTVDLENLLECSDRWFRPVYAGVGPDGAVYLADWYDTRLSHVSPTDDWHKTSGRVYRIRPSESHPIYDSGNLAQTAEEQLIENFNHPNKWLRRRSVLELGWKGKTSPESLQKLVNLVDQTGSLESLWAIHLLNQLTGSLSERWMQHPSPDIRRWVTRLLGDRHESHPGLVELAANESDVQVRSQLAATARRLNHAVGLGIVAQLLKHDEDLQDPHMPLMLWWAVESHAEDWPAIEGLVSNRELWERPLMRQAIAGRLMQRYAATGSAADLEFCCQLLKAAPNQESRELLIEGFNQAFQGRTMPPLPDYLVQELKAYQVARGDSGLVLAIQQGDAEACDQGLQQLRQPQTDSGLRIALARAFGDYKFAPAQSTLLQLATGGLGGSPALQRVALQSLTRYDDIAIAKAIAQAFDNSIPAEHALRETGCRTLASRKDWALVLLNEINSWRLPATAIPPDVIQRLRTYADNQIIREVEQAFGPAAEISAPEQAQEIERLTQMLTQSVGNADDGAQLFAERCGKCHRLFGQGATIAPELDNYDRMNLKFWLPAIVAPSLEIREGYQSYLALTADDRVVTGMISAEDGNSVTLRTADNQEILLAREDLLELRALPTSLMPEDSLKDLEAQQIRDLFAYLTRPRPEMSSN